MVKFRKSESELSCDASEKKEGFVSFIFYVVSGRRTPNLQC